MQSSRWFKPFLAVVLGGLLLVMICQGQLSSLVQKGMEKPTAECTVQVQVDKNVVRYLTPADAHSCDVFTTVMVVGVFVMWAPLFVGGILLVRKMLRK